MAGDVLQGFPGEKTGPLGQAEPFHVCRWWDTGAVPQGVLFFGQF